MYSCIFLCVCVLSVCSSSFLSVLLCIYTVLPPWWINVYISIYPMFMHRSQSTLGLPRSRCTTETDTACLRFLTRTWRSRPRPKTYQGQGQGLTSLLHLPSVCMDLFLALLCILVYNLYSSYFSIFFVFCCLAGEIELIQNWLHHRKLAIDGVNVQVSVEYVCGH